MNRTITSVLVLLMVLLSVSALQAGERVHDHAGVEPADRQVASDRFGPAPESGEEVDEFDDRSPLSACQYHYLDPDIRLWRIVGIASIPVYLHGTIV